MPEQDTHFWLMAFATRDGHAGAMGTITPEPGTTQMRMLDLIRDRLVADTPALQHAAVVAFDIQPNKI